MCLKKFLDSILNLSFSSSWRKETNNGSNNTIIIGDNNNMAASKEGTDYASKLLEKIEQLNIKISEYDVLELSLASASNNERGVNLISWQKDIEALRGEILALYSSCSIYARYNGFQNIPNTYSISVSSIKSIIKEWAELLAAR